MDSWSPSYLPLNQSLAHHQGLFTQYRSALTWLGLIEPGNPPQSIGNDYPDICAHGLLGVSSVPFKASKLWLTCLCLLPPLIIRELHRPNHDTPLLRVVPRCPIAEHKVLFVLLTPPLASFPTFFTKSPLRQQSKCSVFLGHTTGLPTAPLLHVCSSVTFLTKPLHSRPGHRKALLCPLHPLLAHTLEHALIPRSLQNSQSTTNSGAPWEEMGLFLTESRLSASSIITPGMNSLRHSPETTHCLFRTSFSLSPKNLQVHFEQHFSLACPPLFAARLIPCISQHW